jgi:hypothetical protein
MSVNQKVYVTFPKEKIRESIICKMYDEFKVVFNIRTASVNDFVGLMALELTADKQDTLDKAVEFLRNEGLTVDPIEMDVVRL